MKESDLEKSKHLSDEIELKFTVQEWRMIRDTVFFYAMHTFNDIQSEDDLKMIRIYRRYMRLNDKIEQLVGHMFIR
jgi:hypothetical protein